MKNCFDMDMDETVTQSELTHDKNANAIMDRIFVVVTPVCPHYPGRKVGSKECTQCDHFRGGIVQNFVDCAHNRKEIEQKTPKSARKAAEIAHPAKKRGRPAKKAISKPVKTRKKKNG